MSNFNKLDGISAVKDLTDAAAAVVEGGIELRGGLSFDSFQGTGSFSVSRGRSVNYSSRTAGGKGSSSSFTAVLKNIDNVRATPPKKVSMGSGTASWTNVRGGNYRIELRDRQDGSFITGDYTVLFT